MAIDNLVIDMAPIKEELRSDRLPPPYGAGNRITRQYMALAQMLADRLPEQTDANNFGIAADLILADVANGRYKFTNDTHREAFVDAEPRDCAKLVDYIPTLAMDVCPRDFALEVHSVYSGTGALMTKMMILKS